MQVGIIVGIYIDDIYTITMDIVLQTDEISIRNINTHIGQQKLQQNSAKDS